MLVLLQWSASREELLGVVLRFRQPLEGNVEPLESTNHGNEFPLEIILAKKMRFLWTLDVSAGILRCAFSSVSRRSHQTKGIPFRKHTKTRCNNFFCVCYFFWIKKRGFGDHVAASSHATIRLIHSACADDFFSIFFLDFLDFGLLFWNQFFQTIFHCLLFLTKKNGLKLEKPKSTWVRSYWRVVVIWELKNCVSEEKGIFKTSKTAYTGISLWTSWDGQDFGSETIEALHVGDSTKVKFRSVFSISNPSYQSTWLWFQLFVLYTFFSILKAFSSSKVQNVWLAPNLSGMLLIISSFVIGFVTCWFVEKLLTILGHEEIFLQSLGISRFELLSKTNTPN